MDKIEIFAKALWALQKDNLLVTAECKKPVKAFIRQASECNYYHCSTHYRSRQVESQLQGIRFKSAAEYHRYCSTHFSHEHMVPVEVLYRLIITNPGSPKNIEDLLRRFSQRATITKDQNELLLRSTMPDRFYEAPDDPESHLARYAEAKIADDLVPRTSDSWV